MAEVDNKKHTFLHKNELISSQIGLLLLLLQDVIVLSGILVELGIPTADTIVHNSHVLFASHCSLSCNQIVEWFANIAVW